MRLAKPALNHGPHGSGPVPGPRLLLIGLVPGPNWPVATTNQNEGKTGDFGYLTYDVVLHEPMA